MRRILCFLIAAFLLVASPAVQAATTEESSGGGGGHGFDDFDNPYYPGTISSAKWSIDGVDGYADVPVPEYDEKGRIKKGYLELMQHGTIQEESDQNTYYALGKYTLTNWVGSCLFIAYQDNESDPDYGRYVVWTDATLENPSYISINSTGSVKYVNTKTGTSLIKPVDVRNVGYGWDFSTGSELGKYYTKYMLTNLPVFKMSDRASMQAYVDNGDISGALNKPGLQLNRAQADGSDTSLIMPKISITNKGNFNCSGSSLTIGGITAGWNSQADGSYYDISMRMHFYFYKKSLSVDWGTLIAGGSAVIGSATSGSVAGVGGGIAQCIAAFGSSSDLIGTSWGSWSAPIAVPAAASSTVYTFSESDITKLITNAVKSAGASDYFFDQIEIRVRHRVGSKYGYYRVVNINYSKDLNSSTTSSLRDDNDVEQEDPDPDSPEPDFDDGGGSSSGGGKTDVKVDGANITINVDNHTKQENKQTNNQTNNNQHTSNNVDNIIGGTGSGSDGSTGSGIDWSFSDVFGLIKGGFGLLGDSGLIALLGGLIGFLPSNIMTLLTLMVTVTVVCVILGLFIRLFKG